VDWLLCTERDGWEANLSKDRMPATTTPINPTTAAKRMEQQHPRIALPLTTSKPATPSTRTRDIMAIITDMVDSRMELSFNHHRTPIPHNVVVTQSTKPRWVPHLPRAMVLFDKDQEYREAVVMRDKDDGV
jgi:hypothetical protein